MTSATTIIEPGSSVELHDGVRAVVTAASIYPGKRVIYQVVWWAGSTRNEQWVEEFEVKAAGNTESRAIGFHASA